MRNPSNPRGPYRKRPIDERFWEKVDRRGPDECWPWTAAINPNGYGKFGMVVEGRTLTVDAHRVAYQLVVGEIPEGLTIDHVKARGCTMRRCCNPAHLEAVTRGENVLRGDGGPAVNARKTHCIRGHEFAGSNLYINPRNGWRACRACARIRDEARR